MIKLTKKYNTPAWGRNYCLLTVQQGLEGLKKHLCCGTLQGPDPADPVYP